MSIRTAIYQRLDADIDIEFQQGYIHKKPKDDLFATILLGNSYGIKSTSGFIPVTVWVYSSGQDYSILDTTINDIRKSLSPEFVNPISNKKLVCRLDDIGDDDYNSKIDCICKYVSFDIPVVF